MLLGGVLLGLLVWQGHRVAHLVPQAEAAVADLGVWGPLVYMAGVALLSPLLFPDSLFGIVAGFVFGLADGTLYYFVAIYLANLAIFALGRTWLRGPILRFVENRPNAQAILRGAHRDSLRLTLLIRLVPVNVAFVSYVLGAGRFPWRAVLIGNFALLPHLFLPVYLGHVARDATELAARGAGSRYVEDVGVLAGLVAAAIVVAVVTRMASRAMEEMT
jgi:uncharacterized membrane protein YdjX (TVP38/TMEM64 family)